MGIVLTLGEIAQLVGARLNGDPNTSIQGLQTLSAAGPQQLSFITSNRYRADLAVTQAAAVLVSAEFEADCPVAALVVDNPYLAYATISQYFETRPTLAAGIHPTAVVADDAQVAADARIGAGAVVESGVRIETGVEVGAGSVVGARSVLANGVRLAARVVLYHDVTVGPRSIIHSGAVIGADGFGYAPKQQQWQKIAQVGGVEIGADVEIGANTTIDRGALLPTRIADGVKIDNQVHVAHNCEIGEDTAIAGCVGIAGSTKIGRRCTIAGGVGIAGHLEIADGVHVTAMALITKSLKEKGVYSSGTGTLPHSQWKRNVVRFRQLDKLAGRVAALEASAEQQHKG